MKTHDLRPPCPTCGLSLTVVKTTRLGKRTRRLRRRANADPPRPPRALLRHFLRLLVEAESDLPGVLFVLAADEVARPLKEAQHAAVVGHHQGGIRPMRPQR